MYSKGIMAAILESGDIGDFMVCVAKDGALPLDSMLFEQGISLDV